MALNPSLSPTPPMGFNTWNRFAGSINQDLIEETMSALIEEGLARLGYVYLNIDDGWMAPERNAQGELVPDPERFPGGIARLAERAHAAGLKLGIYSCCGTKTCMGLPASYGHEGQDAKTFASWGIDYLKQDWCSVPYEDFPGKSHREVAQELYGRISQGIEATNHPMVLSMCNWGDGESWQWARGIAHLWRTTSDIADVFCGETPQWAWDVVRIFEKNSQLDEYAGPGGWNDPDMLEVGNGGMSEVEYRSHFTLWCMMAAPLLIGTDLRRLDPSTRSILTNTDLIAVNQDALGVQAPVVRQTDGVYTLKKPLAGGDRALAVFNASETDQTVEIDWTTLVHPGNHHIKDLWSGKNEVVQGKTSVDIPSHATQVWRLYS